MAASRTKGDTLAASSVTAGSTRASGGATGTAIDVSAAYGGSIGWIITNGTSAPGVPLTVVLQVTMAAVASAVWLDHYTTVGDTLGSASTIPQTGDVEIPFGAQGVRAIAFGNTTNAVTVTVSVSYVTAL